MIKIGRSYFNERQIAAIQPNIPDDRVDVYLVRGAVISEEVHEDDLQELLERAGLLVNAPAVDPLIIPPTENAELWTAYEDGYLFAAKDQSGQVYAYSVRPEKQTQTWIDADGGKAPRRLHGDFDFLSFEDEAPLALHDLFSFRDGEEEEEE